MTSRLAKQSHRVVVKQFLFLCPGKIVAGENLERCVLAPFAMRKIGREQYLILTDELEQEMNQTIVGFGGQENSP